MRRSSAAQQSARRHRRLLEDRRAAPEQIPLEIHAFFGLASTLARIASDVGDVSRARIPRQPGCGLIADHRRGRENPRARSRLTAIRGVVDHGLFTGEMQFSDVMIGGRLGRSF